MMFSRGMGDINPKKVPKTGTREAGCKSEGYAKGGKTKSKVNEAGNYTNPGMRKSLFESIKSSGKGGDPGEWSGRKAQMLAKQYKAKGGGYK